MHVRLPSRDWFMRSARCSRSQVGAKAETTSQDSRFCHSQTVLLVLDAFLQHYMHLCTSMTVAIEDRAIMLRKHSG